MFSPTASMSTATVRSRTLSVCLTATKHSSSAASDFSASCPFFKNETLVPLYAFYGLQNAAYNNVFDINVQDFCGSMTVCFFFFVFFVLLMLIKGEGGKLKRPSDAVVLLSSCHCLSFFHFFKTIHPVASVLEMRCKEYLRLFYILVVFMYVYICVYIHTHLHLFMPFHSHGRSYPSHVRSCRPLSSFLLWSIMCWFIHS